MIGKLSIYIQTMYVCMYVHTYVRTYVQLSNIHTVYVCICVYIISSTFTEPCNCNELAEGISYHWGLRGKAPVGWRPVNIVVKSLSLVTSREIPKYPWCFYGLHHLCWWTLRLTHLFSPSTAPKIGSMINNISTRMIPSGNLVHSYWKWPFIFSRFSHWKWWIFL